MLYGDDGDDRILGEDGNDFINAGAGDDTAFGGDGDDMFVAEAGDGDDTYYGDDMVGGSGNDTLDMSSITAAITADLGTGFMGRGSVSSSETGNDGLWGVENIVTGSGDDTITASRAVNVMDGGAGNDTFRFPLRRMRTAIPSWAFSRAIVSISVVWTRMAAQRGTKASPW
ncbi:hypothetical protein HSBAA_21860 [Vreelandella sulfidaeris]|uniref:Calcium-binding protein n=1 Tax=Vreelandella sulfidaeris TaxID=115553 RepID=A0A455U452_9GAMM|nr:hypothetical protein HSBAA_21860 [Halomonas sulfidaeris]